jgi:hypothetical protein
MLRGRCVSDIAWLDTAIRRNLLYVPDSTFETNDWGRDNLRATSTCVNQSSAVRRGFSKASGRVALEAVRLQSELGSWRLVCICDRASKVVTSKLDLVATLLQTATLLR